MSAQSSIPAPRAPVQDIVDRLTAASAPTATLLMASPGAGLSAALRQLADALGARVWRDGERPAWASPDALRRTCLADWPEPNALQPAQGQDVLILDRLARWSEVGRPVEPPEVQEISRWIGRWLTRGGAHIVIGVGHWEGERLHEALEDLRKTAPALSGIALTWSGLGALTPADVTPAQDAVRALVRREKVWSGALVQRWWSQTEPSAGAKPPGPPPTPGLFEGLLSRRSPKTAARSPAQAEPSPLPDWMKEHAERLLRDLSPRQRDLLLARCAYVGDPGERDGDDQTLNRLATTGLLVEEEGQAPRIGDPVLERYLTVRLPRPTRLHHISDVHFGGPQGWSDVATGPAPGSGPPTGAADLLTSVTDLLSWREVQVGQISNKTCQPPERYLDALLDRRPDAVILSGDLLFRGDLKGELDAGVAWLKTLRATLAKIHSDPTSAPPWRLCVVGGNHDVQRPDLDYTNEDERHLRFRKNVLAPINGDGDLQAMNRNQLRIYPMPNLGIEIILLESAILGGEPNRVIHKLIGHMDALAKKARARWCVNKETRSLIDESQKVAEFVKRDMGSVDPGMVEPRLIHKLEKLPPSLELVRIAVLHHPISPIPGASTKEFPIVTNATALKKALFTAEVPLVLHGHEHRYHVAAERWSSPTAPPGAPSRSEKHLRIRNERTFTPEIVQISAPTLASLDSAHGQGFVELEIQSERSWLGDLLSVDLKITHHLLTSRGDDFAYVAQPPTRLRVHDRHTEDSLPLLPTPARAK